MTSEPKRSESLMQARMLQRLCFALGASFVLHAAAYASVRARPRTEPAKVKSEVAFVVTEQHPPKVTLPEPPPPAPEEPVVKASRSPRPEPAPEKASQPERSGPFDLTGVTLTGDGPGTGFAMPVGDGSALRATAPRRPVAKPAAPEVAAPAVARESGPPLVAVADLGSRPAAPDLGSALHRNYPEDARRRGLSGTGEVRVRIDADGVARSVAPLAESAAGFAEACRRAVKGSRWSPPRDRSGRAVSTEVRYRCRFLVEE
jgi:TonB family protein